MEPDPPRAARGPRRSLRPAEPEVRVVTYYGTDNQIDGIVLDVLLRKHKTIRSSLGISVPVPVDTEQVIEGDLRRLAAARASGTRAEQLLPASDDDFAPQKQKLHDDWEAAAEREKRSRTMFAQETIKVDEVGAGTGRRMRAAIGSGVDVAAFHERRRYERTGRPSRGNGDLQDQPDARLPRALREAPWAARRGRIKARFELPGAGKRTVPQPHPSDCRGARHYVMDTALDPLAEGDRAALRRDPHEQGGARTTLLLVRFRYHIVTQRGDAGKPLAGGRLPGPWPSPDRRERPVARQRRPGSLLGASPGAQHQARPGRLISCPRWWPASRAAVAF